VAGIVFLLTLLLPLVGRLAGFSGRMVLLSVVLCVLVVLQVISPELGRTVAFMAAVHPANAMLMVCVTVLLLVLHQVRCFLCQRATSATSTTWRQVASR
jgi:uncharacterized membrane protein